MKLESPEKQIAEIYSEKDAEIFISKWSNTDSAFHQELNNMLAENDISVSQVMKMSGINRNYGYNIINGNRTRPGRDKVLALCIAARLSLEKTQDMLARAEAGCLYYNRERDVWIAMCLNNKEGDVLKVNLLLESKGLAPLSV